MVEWYKRIPNWLTFLRLVLIPVFVIVLLDPNRSTLNVAAVIFVLAALTDYADGIIARHYAAESDFGKLFDPLADKILVMAALVMLTSLHDETCKTFVPGWMVVFVLAREFWITGLRAFAAKDGVIVAARSGGKVKSFLQMVSILALLLYDRSFTVFGERLTFQFIGLNLLLLSIVFSYVSAVDYSLAILAPDGSGWNGLARSFGRVFLGIRDKKVGDVSKIAVDASPAPAVPSKDSSTDDSTR